jgi:tRNA threonylcarbamoyladenosine modification (KEOPS) complex  Pcc1 subunit
MRYSSIIKAYGDSTKIYECFLTENVITGRISKKGTCAGTGKSRAGQVQAAEQQEYGGENAGRSRVEMKKRPGFVEFHITAEDAAAFRAAFNAVAKLLGVYEKMDGVKNG